MLMFFASETITQGSWCVRTMNYIGLT